jgi:hypothetical protein
VAAWQLLTVEFVAGSAAYLLFLRYSWFAGVRAVVDDALRDLLPRRAAAV